MQAGSAAASIGRRTGGRVRGAFISTALVGALLAVPGTALGAKGGGSAGGTVSPWIALASVEGGAGASAQPALGSTVRFASGYASTTKNPWVSLRCFQGSNLVFAAGGSPGSQFVLGGASSTWLTVGGSATCSADLGDLYWRGGREYYTYLATTSFDAN